MPSQPSPALSARGWQVLPVDYNNQSDVRYKLVGVDTVISTISGQAQLSLIDAAAEVHVRRFVPSEFEGSPLQRPDVDPLDRGQKTALAKLQEKQQLGMEYTIFTCGIFYERFYPGGMSTLQLGAGTHISGEGQYILEIRRQTASIPCYPSGDGVYICMTSAEDVARYVVAALDLPHWPNEFLLAAERMTIDDIVAAAEVVSGEPFQRQYYDHATLLDSISYASATNDTLEYWRLRYLMATLQGRYDFHRTNLNQLVNIQAKPFFQWLLAAWSDVA
uniref:Isoflavone reductase like n=1 Tax=Talaromyces marneffei PM1 TaxID=1077442 RepID=A0A093V9R0_TALMA